MSSFHFLREKRLLWHIWRMVKYKWGKASLLPKSRLGKYHFLKFCLPSPKSQQPLRKRRGLERFNTWWVVCEVYFSHFVSNFVRESFKNFLYSCFPPNFFSDFNSSSLELSGLMFVLIVLFDLFDCPLHMGYVNALSVDRQIINGFKQITNKQIKVSISSGTVPGLLIA